MAHIEVLKKISNENKEYMFYEEFVLDVTDFKYSHPGGTFMLSDAIGEDTGKYMIGCSSSNGDLLPYTHSEEAFEMLKSLIIGKIPYPDDFIIPFNHQETMDSMTWAVKSRHDLSHFTYLLILGSHNFRINTKCKNPAWLGKHFKITAEIKGKKISRYYSAMLCNLADWASECEENGYSISKYPKTKSGRLQLIYKTYPKGLVTQYLDTLLNKDKVILKGPLGPGLCLSEFSGKYLGFAGGTGLVPFLDVAYYLWSTRNQKSHFSFTLIISFRALKDIFALDLLEATASELGEQRFKLIILTHERSQNLPELAKQYAKTNPDLAWICGPSGYNKLIHDLLIEEGLRRDKVIVM